MNAVSELHSLLGGALTRNWQRLTATLGTCNLDHTQLLNQPGLRGGPIPHLHGFNVALDWKEKQAALPVQLQSSSAQLELQTAKSIEEGSLQLLQCRPADELTAESALGGGRNDLKQAHKRKRALRKHALRKCLLEAGLSGVPVEKMLASAPNVGDHAEAGVELCCREGGAAALVGQPWLLKCNHQDLLALHSVLLGWGVSLRGNMTILRYGLEHGPANVEQVLHLMAHLGVPDLTRLLHAYPKLLAQRYGDVVAKLEYLRSLGLREGRLCHFFCTNPHFIAPSLPAMQNRVAFYLEAGFTQNQTVQLISRRPLGLGCDVSSHFSHVGDLFKDFGFSPADFAYVVERYPHVLVCKVETNLRPKLRYFVSRGLTLSQLVAMVRAYPFLLAKNLNTSLKPKVEFLVGAMERDISELVPYATLLGYSMARLQRRQATVAQYGISCSLSTMLNRTDAQFEAYVHRISRQTYQAKMAGVREIYQRQQRQKPAVLDMIQVADFELPVYKMHSGGQLKWPTR